MTNRPISEILPAGSSSYIRSAAGHWNRHKEDSWTVNCQLGIRRRMPSLSEQRESKDLSCLLLARRSFSAGGPLTLAIPAPWATAALRVVPAPTFTTTSRIHCRHADNLVMRHTAAAPRNRKGKSEPRRKAAATQARESQGDRLFAAQGKTFETQGKQVCLRHQRQPLEL